MTNTLQQTQSDPPGAVSEATSTLVEKASDVGSTISDQTRNVANDAKDHARQIVGESRESLRSEASTQAARLATTMREIGGQLRSMSQSQSGGGMAVDVSRQLSDAANRAAEKLDTGGIDDVLTDLKRFARRRPGLFLAGAVGAGFAAGRLLKAADTHSLMEAAHTSNDERATPAAPALAPPSFGIAETIQ
ncbi:MAG: hypothetical protein ABI658_12970 [Acidimicrobiales bacterium]